MTPRFPSERTEPKPGMEAIGLQPQQIQPRYRHPDVEQARRPLTLPGNRHADRQTVTGALFLLATLAAVFATVGLLEAVIFCCHHWRGTIKALYVSAAAAYLLFLTSRTKR